MNLNQNVGRLDQLLRSGIALFLVYIGFIDTSLLGDNVTATLVGIFGVLNMIAAVLGWCPVYQLAGINTRTIKR